ncbi:unnamed protein product [Clavelina lepadiformis]|uniref:Uncharacterized protein n=1 Tax=Clavelina lepadiformis TaxID=159417 RepID=A0ABP0FC49_CLALP
MCETKIEWHQSFVIRACKEEGACLDNRNGNPRRCYNEEAFRERNRECFSCCDGASDCNNQSEIPERPSRL